MPILKVKVNILLFYELINIESILRSYKKQITLDSGNVQDQQFRSEAARFMVEGENHFRGISTDEFMARSRKFMEAQINKQAWSPIKKPDISEGNLDYEKYSKNFVKVRDVAHTSVEAANEFSLGKNMVNFIKNLDDNMQEKQQMNSINQRITEKIRNPAAAARRIEQYWQRAGTGANNLIPHKLRGRKKIDMGDPERNVVPQRPVYGRVSPWAKEEIYKLHLEGWTIRDLSVRFGLLPERVKFIVWSKQYFYDEIFPRVDLATIELALEREMLYSVHFPWVDYGKDLYVISRREKGLFFQRYRLSEIDVNPPKEVQERMERVLENQTKRRYDIVTEGFHGHGGKGFYLKSWIVNKGHGSERVNRKFKMVIQHTRKNQQLIPDRARTRMGMGPRIAALGYGIK